MSQTNIELKAMDPANQSVNIDYTTLESYTSSQVIKVEGNYLNYREFEQFCDQYYITSLIQNTSITYPQDQEMLNHTTTIYQTLDMCLKEGECWKDIISPGWSQKLNDKIITQEHNDKLYLAAQNNCLFENVGGKIKPVSVGELKSQIIKLEDGSEVKQGVIMTWGLSSDTTKYCYTRDWKIAFAFYCKKRINWTMHHSDEITSRLLLNSDIMSMQPSEKEALKKLYELFIQQLNTRISTIEN